MATPRFPDDPGRHIPIGTRRFIVARDGNVCHYCWEEAYSIDHIFAYSNGGDHAPHNLVACCHRCNSTLGNRKFDLLSEKVAWMRNYLVTIGERTVAIAGGRNHEE